MVTVALLVVLAQDGGGAGANLLRGATIRRADGASDVSRMADGIAPVDGDVWKSPSTAVLAANGVVEWEFATPVTIRALRLQADNNDVYRISTSPDGVTFSLAWVAGPVGVPGLQTRTSEELNLTVKVLRLTAEGGDSMYSIGELEAYATSEERSTASLRRIVPPPPPKPPPLNTAHVLVVGIAAAFAYWLYRARQANVGKGPPAAP